MDFVKKLILINLLEICFDFFPLSKFFEIANLKIIN